MTYSLDRRTLALTLARVSSLHLLLAAAGLPLGLPAAAHAQEVAPVPPPVALQSHTITGVVFQYTRDHPQNPPAAELLEATFNAVATQDGWAAPLPRESTQPVRLSELPTLRDQRFTDTGLTLLAPAVVELLKSRGLGAVYVTPDPAQFRVQDGRVLDLRPQGETTITLVVTLGVISELHTVGIGERIPVGKEGDKEGDKAEQSIDHPLHQRVLNASPVKAGDLLYQETIDDYLYFLKRRPGRRADVALSAPGDEPGAVKLDYVITENRPWLLFAQVASTGTEATSRFRERFGFIHNDLTNHDDILDLQYTTANFEDTHQVQASYDRPFSFNDRLRWRVDASYYTYTASDVGLPGFNFDGEGWNAGGSLAWNFYQRGPLFLDLVAGAHFKHVSVNNELAAIEGEDDFFVPSIALVLERNTEAVQTNAMVSLEGNLSGVAGTNDNLDPLGRAGADSDYYILKAAASHDFYLEPYFDPYAASTGGLAHQLHFAVSGQYAFDNRLIPNEEQPVGGLYTVRGYPESSTAGDTVVMATAEYRYHLPKDLSVDPVPGSLFGKPFRWRPQYQYGPTDWDLILKAFVDGARVLNTDRIDYSYESDNTLLSAGVGVELSVTRRVNLRVDWGFALKDLDNSDGTVDVDAGHNELHFVLTLIY